MDVLQIEGSPQSFRVLPRPEKGLTTVPIEKGESEFKLCKIVGKKTVEGGRTQLNFHDGRNLILQAHEPRQRPGEEYAVGAAIQLGLPEQKIFGHIPFQTGAIGLVVDGRNQGHFGKIFSITPGTHARRKGVRIETTDEAFETPAAYVIPIGMGTPLIGLGKQ